MKKQFALIIDLDKCIGCKGCSVSCYNQHDISAGIYFCTLGQEGPIGVFPNLQMSYIPRNCMHCSNPSCADACPAKAISITDAGVVIIDEVSCTGCGECVSACPYEACHIDQVEQVAKKCDMCLSLIREGGSPICVTTCQGLARLFGDINDPDSTVARIMEKNKGIIFREKESFGTNPNVYYLPVRT